MKTLVVILMAILLTASAFVWSAKSESGISGTIDPADGARKVWAIMGNDSLSVLPVSGKFLISVKPGNWNLYIEAAEPYKSTTVTNIAVIEGGPTDAGVIKLMK